MEGLLDQWIVFPEDWMTIPLRNQKTLDELAKDETKRTEYTNSMSVLMHMYETKGNPHKNEIVQKVNEYVKTKTTKAEVTEALNEANEAIAA